MDYNYNDIKIAKKQYPPNSPLFGDKHSNNKVLKTETEKLPK